MTERGRLDARKLVREALAEIAARKVRNVPALREVRRGLSAKLRIADPADVKAVALGMAKAGRKWLGYKIINQHKAAAQSVTIKEIEVLADGMAS